MPVPALPPPKPAHVRTLTKADYALYAGVAAYRLGDYITTEHDVHMPHGHEWMLPNTLVQSRPGFAAFSVGMGAGEIAGSYWLHKHGHTKLARTLDAVSVASGGAIVLSNTMH